MRIHSGHMYQSQSHVINRAYRNDDTASQTCKQSPNIKREINIRLNLIENKYLCSFVNDVFTITNNIYTPSHCSCYHTIIVNVTVLKYRGYIYMYIYIYIYIYFKGKILHLCIFVSPNNSILPSSGIIQIIRHFYIYCNSK